MGPKKKRPWTTGLNTIGHLMGSFRQFNPPITWKLVSNFDMLLVFNWEIGFFLRLFACMHIIPLVQAEMVEDIAWNWSMLVIPLFLVLLAFAFTSMAKAVQKKYRCECGPHCNKKLAMRTIRKHYIGRLLVLIKLNSFSFSFFFLTFSFTKIEGNLKEILKRQRPADLHLSPRILLLKWIQKGRAWKSCKMN